MNQLISVSELRQSVARVLKQAQVNGEPCVVVSRSRPVAVILSADAYQAMRNRLRELEEAELLHAVREGEREFRAGKARRLRSLRDLR